MIKNSPQNEHVICSYTIILVTYHNIHKNTKNEKMVYRLNTLENRKQLEECTEGQVLRPHLKSGSNRIRSTCKPIKKRTLPCPSCRVAFAKRPRVLPSKSSARKSALSASMLLGVEGCVSMAKARTQLRKAEAPARDEGAVAEHRSAGAP